MFRTIAATAALVLLTACGDGQPFDFGVPNTPVPETPSANGIPEKLGGNLEAVSYVPNASTGGSLSVTITSLDTTPLVAAYTRNAALDVPGYTAFSIQEDPLDRMFIAMIARSADGTVQGALVQDGGQFTKYFGGTSYSQIGAYSPHVPSQPNSGLVSYAGDYVGTLNGGAPRPNEALPIPPGTNPANFPEQPLRITGQVFINADFTDNTVNGAISDRELIDLNVAIPDVFLIPTAIATNGVFYGDVEDLAQTNVGNYGGTFGGIGATAVAGSIRLTGDFIPTFDREEEYGIFVLTQCGQTGDAPICDAVNPP